ncbi:MAG: helix-turn-helix domain-containing protein [Saprospiraceae bacterium]|nr:helix-turn-helix domain-containing protein [Bacteroidia bacterium]NNE15895.1 helix-turn-helix domain-containing protein [Saprospiraceae bacterium]NNL93170.1 helix-turn-helix domain-containing protein [Saprospiraceae bacterium]
MNYNPKLKIPQQNLLGKKNFLIKPLLPFINKEVLDEKPHKHNFQEIIFIKSGTGKHLIDDNTYVLVPSTFYLIGKGQVHEFIEGANLEGFLIRFLDNFLPPSGLNTHHSLNSTLLGSIISINELHIENPEVAYYESLLSNLYYEFSVNKIDYAKTQIIQFLLLALLTKLERRMRSLSKEKIIKTVDNDTKLYHSFLLLIDENYFKEHAIQFYVNELRVNKRKLGSICKAFSKKTPKQILNERLMVEAKRMLLYTGNSSKEIAFGLGYEDPAYFSRFFKKYYGLSPREFKLGSV